MDTISDDDWLERLASLRLAMLSAEHQRRAWHKPLMLLVALREVHAGRPRLREMSFYTDKVGSLLDQFQPAAAPGRQRARNPWLHLPNDRVWETSGNRARDHGGLPEPDWRQLRGDNALVQRSIGLLLHAYFPPTLHQDLTVALRLEHDLLPRTGELIHDVPERVTILVSRLERTTTFVTEVLDTYQRTCVICGYNGNVRGQPVGVDAAHIRGLADGGPDAAANGWALCVLHHRLFDRGLFSVDAETLMLRVSPWFSVRPQADPLGPHADRPVTVPEEADLDRDQLNWHAEVAFLT